MQIQAASRLIANWKDWNKKQIHLVNSKNPAWAMDAYLLYVEDDPKGNHIFYGSTKSKHGSGHIMLVLDRKDNIVAFAMKDRDQLYRDAKQIVEGTATYRHLRDWNVVKPGMKSVWTIQ